MNRRDFFRLAAGAALVPLAAKLPAAAPVESSLGLEATVTDRYWILINDRVWTLPQTNIAEIAWSQAQNPDEWDVPPSSLRSWTNVVDANETTPEDE